MKTLKIGRCFYTLWLTLILVAPIAYGASTKNGFDLSNATIPIKEILGGGVKRDGIPAIDRPRFISPDAVDYLRGDDLVVSVESGGNYRAYPIRILNHHEIVNDSIGEDHFTVTYCPLCGTAMVFDRMIEGRVVDFGVSGLLFQSDVLLYDRETESLWSQLGMKSVAGPMVGKELKWRVSEHMTWEEWKKNHPDGEVLSKRTGYERPYFHNPYADYEKSRGTMFPVSMYRKELSPKTWVLGIKVDGHPAAYELALFPPNTLVKDSVNGVDITIEYDPKKKKAVVTHADTAEVIPSVFSYWFAWQAFYPRTKLSMAPKVNKQKKKKGGG